MRTALSFFAALAGVALVAGTHGVPAVAAAAPAASTHAPAPLAAAGGATQQASVAPDDPASLRTAADAAAQVAPVGADASSTAVDPTASTGEAGHGKADAARLAARNGSARAEAAAPSDAAFLAARDAFVAGDRQRFEAAALRARGHLLEPWLGYWRLRLRHDDLEPGTVRETLKASAGTVAGERARVEWLKWLAMRRDWAGFGADYLPGVGIDDAELRCYAIQYRRAQTGDDALAEAKALWLTGQELPDSCRPLFDALFARGDLGAADVWARLRLAGETGRHRLAAMLNDRLPASDKIAARLLDKAASSPLKLLGSAELRLDTRSGRELALYALANAARDSAPAAREAWLRVRERLPRDDRRYGNAQLAYQAARRLHSDALVWYREAGEVALSDLALAWKVRAALRARAWPDVVAAVDAMTAAGRRESAWRYWRARAQRELGAKEESDAELAELAAEFNFYGLLAAEDLGRTIDVASRPVVADDQAVKNFASRADVRRVLKFYELDMRPEALAEWAYALRGASDAELLLAAEFARRQGLYDRAINAAERTRSQHDFALRFLAPYRAPLAAAARQHGLDEALVLGLVRQESRFVADIVSSAGAVGLMQVMPATAKWIATRLGRSDFRPSQIRAVDVNAEFGAFYLRHVLDRFGGMPVLAAAAYNAGPGRARAWRADVALEGAIYAESIPFNETRDYVKKVLANAVLYAHQLGLPHVPLRERLGVVPPRGSDATSAQGQ